MFLITVTAEPILPRDLPEALADTFAIKTGFYPRHNADSYRYFRITPQRIRAWREENELAGRDVMRELCDGPMQVNAWLVLLHNTLIGTRHVHATTANAFGDRYIYSLCPSHPDARAYAIGLAKDVTESYPVTGISMESPGFAPYAHGFHHEFALNQPNRWLDAQLGLCFCDHCIAGAAKAGINVRIQHTSALGTEEGTLVQ